MRERGVARRLTVLTKRTLPRNRRRKRRGPGAGTTSRDNKPRLATGVDRGGVGGDGPAPDRDPRFPWSDSHFLPIPPFPTSAPFSRFCPRLSFSVRGRDLGTSARGSTNWASSPLLPSVARAAFGNN